MIGNENEHKRASNTLLYLIQQLKITRKHGEGDPDPLLPPTSQPAGLWRSRMARTWSDQTTGAIAATIKE